MFFSSSAAPAKVFYTKSRPWKSIYSVEGIHSLALCPLEHPFLSDIEHALDWHQIWNPHGQYKTLWSESGPHNAGHHLSASRAVLLSMTASTVSCAKSQSQPGGKKQYNTTWYNMCILYNIHMCIFAVTCELPPLLDLVEHFRSLLKGWSRWEFAIQYKIFENSLNTHLMRPRLSPSHSFRFGTLKSTAVMIQKIHKYH